MSITTIHQRVFDFLMEIHQKNEDFFFSMRQLNRNGRLEKGYWFLGNEYYVSISFWMGSDNSSKSPRATFIILPDSTTYLEINSKFDKKSFFTLDFFKTLSFENIRLDEVNRKYYSGYGKDYLKSLKSFIEGDKIIIDEYVRRHTNILAEDGIDDGGIEFIWPGSFAKQLKIVRKYQKIRADKAKKTGYLRNLHIRKFGPIKNLSITKIPEGCRWIFLTGENGSGKTSVLRAIASAICQNNDHGIEVAPQYKDFDVEVGIDHIDGISQHIVKGRDNFEEKKWLTKGFASYGPVRLITEGSLSDELINIDKSRVSRRATLGLFSPISVLRDISGNYVLSVKPKYYEMSLDDFLENIERNLELILPNIYKVNLVRSGEGRKILYHQGDGKSNMIQDAVGFENLPSGTRNFAALILDLLIRFTEQQDNVSDISDYVGIVLIDEIDLHLHPKMQKEIIVQLSETFPNIQFIVTTHSPIPMLGAPKNSIFININRDSKHQICAKRIDIDVSNLLPNSILTSPIFNFDELINGNHNPNEHLMTEDDYDEAIFYRILEKKIRERSINPE